MCFCGTLLTVTRTGHYPASLAIGEPGLSSIDDCSPKATPIHCDHLAYFQPP
ncbi:hypothetical protein SynSYN20_00260 [Synechococcus sp. SYN20]|nr:hypothetical protein SynSYN20_00260 [Synechococcus sp. SYN20]